jgi:hypothetical protein
MVSRRPTHPLLAVALGIAIAGCARPFDDLPRVPAAGTVTMDGRPLPEAVIQFYPLDDASKTRTVGANGQVKDGRFSIPREDGPVPGKYRVSISHAELKTVTPKGQNKSIPSRSNALGPEQIPARYNAKSELKAEIKPGGAEDLKFELQSK